MKSIFSLLLVLSFFALSVSSALADDEIRKLVVDLKAKGFSQTEWKDNLEKDAILFGPGDKFQVQLSLNNAGNRNQTWISVTQSLPASATTDLPSSFRVPQIAAGETYVKNITLTVRSKANVYQTIKSNTYRVDVKSEAGTTAGDYTVFYTNNGTKSTSTSSSGNLPATGSATTLILGSLIAAALGTGAFALRRFSRGY